MQRKEKSKLLGQMIFWFEPKFELDRSPLKNPQIFLDFEYLVQAFMMNFPDSQETFIGLNLFYS